MTAVAGATRGNARTVAATSWLRSKSQYLSHCSILSQPTDRRNEAFWQPDA
jgi:hypothetical protein